MSRILFVSGPELLPGDFIMRITAGRTFVVQRLYGIVITSSVKDDFMRYTDVTFLTSDGEILNVPIFSGEMPEVIRP